MKKKVIISVTNDLVTDQRVHKVCKTLTNMGFDVLLVGRKRKSSPVMNLRHYKTKRMRLLFDKGPVFYFEYHFRLFFLLLFSRADLLVSNDLDTLAPNSIVSWIKNIPLVYDSHEYFTGVPELMDHPFKRGVWKKIERFFLPKVKDSFTVNQSIADLYFQEYGVQMTVVRNVPESVSIGISDRKELGLPEDKKILILQGSGINVQRGAEELVEAMQFVDDVLLLIIGGGDVFQILRDRVKELKLKSKVTFLPRMSYVELMKYTAASDLGLSMDKGISLNYLYSLPNKLFDYLHAGIPVLVSDLPELKNVIEKYNVGIIIPSHIPVDIAEKINVVLADSDQMDEWRKNAIKASEELNWEKESVLLKKVYEKFL
ncbi:MAG: glycosyltransferase [Bacteroidales bacterium]|nr:glycosyltransferase [Bacteroidales bacterium]